MPSRHDRHKRVTNISVGGTLGATLAIEFNYDGARFHFWWDPDQRQHDGKLHKNPLAGVKRGDPEHFEHRQLSAHAAANDRLVAQVLAYVDSHGLIAAYQKSETERSMKEQQDFIALRIENQIKKAGPQLLRLLTECLDYMDTGAPERGDRLPDCYVLARRLIASLQGDGNGIKRTVKGG
jgi:hypothetical protein